MSPLAQPFLAISFRAFRTCSPSLEQSRWHYTPVQRLSAQNPKQGRQPVGNCESKGPSQTLLHLSKAGPMEGLFAQI